MSYFSLFYLHALCSVLYIDHLTCFMLFTLVLFLLLEAKEATSTIKKYR